MILRSIIKFIAKNIITNIKNNLTYLYSYNLEDTDNVGIYKFELG